MKEFRKGYFLAPHEIDDLIEFASFNFKSGGDNDVCVSNVKKPTKYFRITTIANYLEWLCKILISHTGQKDTIKEILVFINNIKRKKPRNNDKYIMDIEKSLDKAQLDSLFSILSPGSNLNPFTKTVQKRNNLMFLLLHCFGMRVGELLNLRIGDIDFAESTIAIRRRANDKTDPRVYQPLVKTCERKLIADTKLIYEISDYILNDRRKVKNSNKHDFLFVTYKEGKTQGQPLSFSSYHKIVSVVRQSSSLLSGLTGHKLRHTWNYEFSKTIDKAQDISDEKEQQIRSYLMGWRPGSDTSIIYNRRHIFELSKKLHLNNKSNYSKEDLMNNLIKCNSDKMSLHEHKIVTSIENDGINIRELICVMNEKLVCGFVYTVQYYFNSNSYLYVKSIVRNMESLIRKLSPTHIDDKVLIEYQNKQSSKAPASFRVLRPFLIKWFEFGYPGIDESAVELLKHFDLKIKKAGQSVLQDDPTGGPLTKEEHTSLIRAMNHAYRIGVLSLSDYAISLLMSLTGRRPQQLVMLKHKDLLQKNLDNGKVEYIISVPRVKQRGKQLQYRKVPIISEVASIVQLQANHSVRLVELTLGKTLMIMPKARFQFS
ncbi:site-specific tyrosine recombinase XerC [Citrobacter koseri]|uniref:Site-specific tyrosine recombinase XerC n=1 Tax=Citrobacter koseri TaxID=545 RepID=A0A3S4IGD9_CITKO|nr:site-specific tyrosine recombinase XerC [Citrobacter koseri]